HLRAVLDYAIDGVFVIDAHGTIESLNPAFERIFGHAAEAIIGKNIAVLMPEDAPWEPGTYMPSNGCADDASGPDTASNELTARRKRGELFPIDLSVSGFTLDGSQHFSAFVRDITLKKQILDELADYTRALERSNKELDDFAYIASHDLKEP